MMNRQTDPFEEDEHAENPVSTDCTGDGEAPPEESAPILMLPSDFDEEYYNNYPCTD